MLGDIGVILPYAVGVAISPVPIIAVILMLFSSRASTNGPVFLGGWVTGLVVATGIVLLLADMAGAASSAPPTWMPVLQVVLGIVLLMLAVEKLHDRPPAGTSAPLPRWLQAVEHLQPGTAFLMGALLSGVNPKNLVLAAAAAYAMARTGGAIGDSLVSFLAFVAIGSSSIALPVVYLRVGGPGAHARLDAARVWLGQNNVAVLVTLLSVFGVLLIGQGLAAL